MKRLIGEWIWRLAVLAALVWIGVEVRQFHEDMLQPVDEPTTAAADTGDELLDTVGDLREAVSLLDDKVNALLIATAQIDASVKSRK